MAARCVGVDNELTPNATRGHPNELNEIPAMPRCTALAATRTVSFSDSEDSNYGQCPRRRAAELA